MRRPTDRNRNNDQSGRGGFTLIELMIVVVVIGILVGLVLPAVLSALARARITEVTTEIRGLEAAIAQFKSVYGVEPPSRIRLYASSSGSPSWTSDPGFDSERLRSIAIINRIWPNFDFTIVRPLGAPVISLTGAECLVLFLGGVKSGPLGGPNAMTGFSKNPADPFAVASGNESREGPFFEFKASRLKASLNSTNAALGVLVYVDPLASQTVPYLYASSYDGRGYQVADLVVGSGDDLDDVYRSTTAVAPAVGVAQKPKSFQIVSPGADALYGAGGFFSPTATSNHGLSNKNDYDNITNFAPGRLND